MFIFHCLMHPISSIWRPLRDHAEDMPLAVCDPETNVNLDDIVAVDHITPSIHTEVAYLRWNAAHRWYWMSDQTPDEVIMMTQYDTHPPGGKFNGECRFFSLYVFLVHGIVVTKTFAYSCSSYRVPKWSGSSRLPKTPKRRSTLRRVGTCTISATG